MRYERFESRTYAPMDNHHRPDYRFPPLRLKHLTHGCPAQADIIAEGRLRAAGYELDDRLDIWTKPGETPCCIRKGYILKLTDGTKRHLSVRNAGTRCP